MSSANRCLPFLKEGFGTKKKLYNKNMTSFFCRKHRRFCSCWFDIWLHFGWGQTPLGIGLGPGETDARQLVEPPLRGSETHWVCASSPDQFLLECHFFSHFFHTFQVGAAGCEKKKHHYLTGLSTSSEM